MRNRILGYFLTAAGILLALCLLATSLAEAHANSATPQSRYYMIVWAYQGPDDDLVHAHTFTSFYRGDDIASGHVRPSTISWLPKTGNVVPFGAEEGRNFSLDETLSLACQAGRDVKSWGPYEIKPELYRSAMRRLKLLHSHRIRYAMMGGPNAMNCITAAGDLTPRRLDTGILWGVAASDAVVRHLSPYIVGPAYIEGLTPRVCGVKPGPVTASSEGN